MPAISPTLLASLQEYTKNIRNICILAHVDHGKTTLSDCLISSNGIISPQMAGNLRYLDFLASEQEREITMKASAISLLFQKKCEEDETKQDSYLINLIDSPGHVDFSSEVSTAVRITDGSLVLVDVVEGVCIQTHAVLKQAYQEKVKPCLVLNKIDRLILELHMTPLEAYQHLCKIIEQVNVITGTLTSEEIILKESSEDYISEEVTTEEDTAEHGNEYYFSPHKGNVAFTTAFDGWGFTTKQFVNFCHKKTGIKKVILEKCLWGEYYYHPKEKKIYKSQKGNLMPMFVTFILNVIWEVVKTIAGTPEWIDTDKLDKIIEVLNISVSRRDLESKDQKIVLKAVLQAWLPLSDAVLDMVCCKLPDPIEGQSRRMEKIFKPLKSSQVTQEMEEKQKQLLKDTIDCNKSDDSEIVAYVAKVFPHNKRGVSTSTVHRPVPPRRVQPSAVPSNRQVQQNPNTNNTTPNNTTNENKDDPQSSSPTQTETTTTELESEIKNLEISKSKPLHQIPIVTSKPSNTEEEFIAVVRVFSGTLKKGKFVYVMGPRYDPLNPTHDVYQVEITQLYLLMGSCIEPIEQVPAGSICGIGGGIGNLVLKSATISSSLMCPPISSMMFVSSPIVKVAIEPENIMDLPKLLHGLKLLNQADPLVEVYVQETGEHVIVASGELHLERCISDLKESFAKINVQVSSPIVPFRETIVQPSSDPNIKSFSPPKIHKETIVAKTANKKVSIKIKAIPLPKNVTNLIEQRSATLRDIFLGGKSANKELSDSKTAKKEAEDAEREEFQKVLFEELEKAGEEWKNEIENIWSFGPRHIGPNLLLNHIPGYSKSSYWIHALKRGIQKKLKKQQDDDDESKEDKEIEEDADTDKEDDNNDEDDNSEDTQDEESVTSENKLLEGEEKFKRIFELDNSIVSGFQLATIAGPLCDEPMMGVCMIVEDIEVQDIEQNSDSYGPLSGQMISAVKEGCRMAFQTKPQRLMEALYLCEIQVTSLALGKMYSVLGSRRAQIQKEGVKEGTQIFCIQARLPVVESFGFSEQIMIKTSGAASTQLFFDNYWETIEQDPYYEPTTEEELEDNGVNVASLGNNIARQYMNMIRKRKGLFVEEKLVEFGDKQRTLKKNK
ncbi:hypothetical protein DICPUDRAFT_149015 [Dictyostelium purpureum]|uniref:Ribosome assembly protein 1 n=1 Tax=Dictyostelium purpureum TaxID=5786 RepID=F0ZCL2_DICPU|nr:uncharacterized protein DICPUDRAFT_149015 [Dictyostelium purpureum]EGC38317.1 hypothetical protein DICPUDRAFT_149015 [Dictyostelium purpureum]|eukprot:XP_003285178.1 hypothetical protein DICPUDRAFT_149015 [Dictyostelium purpureum]